MNTISHHAALIYVMVVVAASDGAMNEGELRTIGELVKTLPARMSFEDYFQRAAGMTVERFAQRAGVLEACRARGIAGLLEIRSVRAVVGTALSLAHGQIFEGWAPAAGDSIDLLHVPSAAASAEVFVTNDGRLRAALERVALDDLRVMNLAEFLAVCSPAEELD